MLLVGCFVCVIAGESEALGESGKNKSKFGERMPKSLLGEGEGQPLQE